MLIARKKRREGAKDGASDRLRRLSQMAKKAVFEEMDSSERGLSPIEVAERLEFYGINEISYDQSDPWYVFWVRAFVDPFILILLGIVFLTYFTDVAFASSQEQSWETIVIISIMILISVALRFTQEYKSQVTADKLKDLVPTTTAVKRKGSSPKIYSIAFRKYPYLGTIWI